MNETNHFINILHWVSLFMEFLLFVTCFLPFLCLGNYCALLGGGYCYSHFSREKNCILKNIKEFIQSLIAYK